MINILSTQSLKSPYVKKIFKNMRDKGTAKVELFSTNINLLCFDIDDFMAELCNVYDETRNLI